MASKIQSGLMNREKGKIRSPVSSPQRSGERLQSQVPSQSQQQQQQKKREKEAKQEALSLVCSSVTSTEHKAAGCLTVYENTQREAGKQVASALQAGSDRILQAVSVETTKKQQSGSEAVRWAGAMGLDPRFRLVGGSASQFGGPIAIPPPISSIPSTALSATAGVTFGSDWMVRQPWAKQDPSAASPTRPPTTTPGSSTSQPDLDESATEDLILKNLKAYATLFKSVESASKKSQSQSQSPSTSSETS
ncbi:hypothetical protein HK102_012966, partial [Quaeritorhiza haematococci]